MKIKQALVSLVLAQGASVLNFPSDGNSKKRLRLKEFKDADPADSHHSLEWTECQKSRVEGLRSRLLLWRSAPQWMRDDLEIIYMLLFWFIGNGFQLALCNVGWLATWESVVLVPGPIVFAPWSVLLDRGEDT